MSSSDESVEFSTTGCACKDILTLKLAIIVNMSDCNKNVTKFLSCE